VALLVCFLDACLDDFAFSAARSMLVRLHDWTFWRQDARLDVSFPSTLLTSTTLIVAQMLALRCLVNLSVGQNEGSFHKRQRDKLHAQRAC
jgi:hypothetical protein